MKSCIACGMPMKDAADHAQGDPRRDYCRHCARPDGSMRSYEETVIGISQWIVRTQGVDPTAARELAREQMAHLPAWERR